MKKLTIRDLIEIAGVLGLIASLMFVGFQLMLDRRIAMGNQYHDRLALGHDWWVSVSENDDYVSFLARQYEDVSLPRWWNEEIESYKTTNSLTMRDVVLLEYTARALSTRLNNNFYQYHLGLISNESWAQILNSINGAMIDPINRAIALDMRALESGYIDIAREIDIGIRQ